MAQNIEERFKNQAKSKTFNNILNKFGLNDLAVLDVGCSYGEFLAHFGPGSLGITISKEEEAYGRGKNLNIIYGNIEAENLNIPENSFDIIFANNIFEHLFSPHNFLCKIKKYLKPGGILILGVTCLPKLPFLLSFKKFTGSLSPGHFGYYNKDTLDLTVSRAGWNIISIRGYHFLNSFFDKMLNPIYPHFYVAAKINNDFQYYEKRVNELMGYLDLNIKINLPQ